MRATERERHPGATVPIVPTVPNRANPGGYAGTVEAPTVPQSSRPSRDRPALSARNHCDRDDRDGWDGRARTFSAAARGVYLASASTPSRSSDEFARLCRQRHARESGWNLEGAE